MFTVGQRVRAHYAHGESFVGTVVQLDPDGVWVRSIPAESGKPGTRYWEEFFPTGRVRPE